MLEMPSMNRMLCYDLLTLWDFLSLRFSTCVQFFFSFNGRKFKKGRTYKPKIRPKKKMADFGRMSYIPPECLTFRWNVWLSAAMYDFRPKSAKWAFLAEFDRISFF